ncbi:MAG TPA: GWxTD domain-containing protein [Thermoanaerobaculia bacterium]
MSRATPNPARRAGLLLALVPALAAALAGGAPGCAGGGNPRLSEPVRQWAAGPVRWLLLPAEADELARLTSDAEAAIFVRELWRRRDPDPGGDGNAARRRFEERVAAADRHYGEAGLRGSLTARGRALVLLGPPHTLRQERRPAPAWRPVSGRGAPMAVRTIPVETWEYRAADLSPALAALLAANGETTVTLSFSLGERAKLTAGERYLVWAAQAMVRLADGDDLRRAGAAGPP